MLVSLSQKSPIAMRAIAVRSLSESSAPLPLEYIASREVLNERLRDVLRGGLEAASKAMKGTLQRAAELRKKASAKVKELLKKKKPEIHARPKPSSADVGIPKQKPMDKPPAETTPPPPKKNLGGIPSKAELKAQQRYDDKGIPIPGPPGEMYPEPWPANLDTTSKGPPIKVPAGTPPEAVLRRRGPKGKPGKYKAAVSYAAMYKHMVRAIYNRGTQSGYSFQHSPSKSSQMIARKKMIDWKYAKRRKSKGGTPDRRMIELTAKGQKRDWNRHLKEPYAVRVAKDRDYASITGQDPY